MMAAPREKEKMDSHLPRARLSLLFLGERLLFLPKSLNWLHNQKATIGLQIRNNRSIHLYSRPYPFLN